MYSYTEADAADFIRAGIQIPLGFHPIYCRAHYVSHAGKATGGTGHDPVERNGRWVCGRCGLVMPAPKLQAQPDPLLSIRKSRLEKALRNAVRVGENVAFPIDPSYPPNVDAYIARAMEELSHE